MRDPICDVGCSMSLGGFGSQLPAKRVHPVEWAPGAGHFHAADLTGVRGWFSSKRLGLRYPSAECRRLSL